MQMLQMKYIRVAAFFEIIFLIVLSTIIIIKAPDNTVNVFNPYSFPQYRSWFSAEGGPIAGVGLGMVFGLTSFIGYGGSAPLGEEATHPKAITRSLVFGLLITGITLTEVSYAQIVGWGIPLMQSFTSSAIPGVITATVYTGAVGGIMFSLVAFNSAFSDSVAMQSNGGRVYYAMGRDYILPKFFSKIHKKYQTPSNALIFVAGMASVLAVGVTFLVTYGAGIPVIDIVSGNADSAVVVTALTDSFDLLTTLALGGLIITHILLNTSVMTMFYRLKEKHKGIKKIIHPVEHYIFPSIATVIFIFVLYESVVPPVYPITDGIIIIALYSFFAAGYSLYLKKTKPDKVKNAGMTVNLAAEEKLSGGSK